MSDQFESFEVYSIKHHYSSVNRNFTYLKSTLGEQITNLLDFIYNPHTYYHYFYMNYNYGVNQS